MELRDVCKSAPVKIHVADGGGWGNEVVVMLFC